MEAIPCARYGAYMALFAPNCKKPPREPPNLSRKPDLILSQGFMHVASLATGGRSQRRADMVILLSHGVASRRLGEGLGQRAQHLRRRLHGQDVAVRTGTADHASGDLRDDRVPM